MKERKLNRAKKNNEQFETIIDNITKYKNKTEVKNEILIKKQQNYFLDFLKSENNSDTKKEMQNQISNQKEIDEEI